jgi:ubiquinone/menaquinone biosynthesis C-methylase UbiE
MGAITRRYDRHARRYEQWWAPVLRPTVQAFVDEVCEVVDGLDAPRVLDVGTGTGSLAIFAARRLPRARVSGVDASRGMLSEAERIATETLTAGERARLDLQEGLADRLPFADGTFDLVLSSFVLQLVPDRPRALREARRVLAPGGWIGYVAWRQDRTPFEPDAAWDRALDAVDAPDVAAESDDRAGDIPSARAAVGQLRRAGFRGAWARESVLEQRWNRRSYLDFVERYDEVDYLESLEPVMRRRIHDAARRELAAVRPTDFVWQTPIVIAGGRRPAGRGEDAPAGP